MRARARPPEGLLFVLISVYFAVRQVAPMRTNLRFYYEPKTLMAQGN